MSSKLDQALFVQQQAMNLRGQRQKVLASNIANADTPGYQARDFDFSNALANAVSGRGQGGLALAMSATGHMQTTNTRAAPTQPVLMYRPAVQASLDNNTVDLDVERANFAENSVQYEASMTFISHQIKMLLSATQN
ncbi:MAG: flagellar basal body rod protein FlgB [Pseudomonadota bacterium]